MSHKSEWTNCQKQNEVDCVAPLQSGGGGGLEPCRFVMSLQCEEGVYKSHCCFKGQRV